MVPFQRTRHAAVGLLISGMVLTFGAAWATDTAVDERSERRLDALGENLRRRIDRQIMSYAEVLFGLRSLFNIAGEISAAEFQHYVADTGVIRRYPGAILVGFARALPLDAPEGGEPKLAVAGPDAGGGVTPPSEARMVIEYIEPVRGNEAALGRDLSVDPARRAAAIEAGDSGGLAATAPIRLHEGGRGFFLTLAVYDTPDMPRTPPARRRHFRGLLIAVFDTDSMLGPAEEQDALLDYDLYDVGLTAEPPSANLSQAEILRDSPGVDLERSARPGRLLDVNVGSRRWRVVATARASLAPSFERQLAPAVLIVGTVLTLVGVGLVSTLARSRGRAEKLADEMTSEVRRHSDDLETANQSLLATNDQLRAAHEAQRTFLRTVSHELQTPLASIMGFSELLVSANGSGDDSADFLRRISRNANTLSRVVADLVAFTQLEGGGTSVLVRPERLDELVRRVVEEDDFFLANHTVSVIVEADVTVLADAHAVTQIVTNLLTNATKFSPAGSAIRVTVSRGATTGDLAVEDEGPGISDHERHRVFEPFFRGSGPEVIATPGTGVGLAVVRELTERMHGHVSVSRSRTGGACLTVSLPTAVP